MKAVHIALGILAISLTGAAAVLGGWCYWRVRQSTVFWRLLRVSQGAVILEALMGGLLVILGHKPPSLHVLYGVLPLLVSFIAEQLRIASAQMILDARGHASADEVGHLPADEQRVVVLSIVQREIGVMALAALVNVVLLARAAGTA